MSNLPLGCGYRISRSLADGQVVLQEQDDRWGFWVTIHKFGDVLRRAHIPTYPYSGASACGGNARQA